ncbi:MAG: hypothetical protein ACRESX_11370 [Gammaproteobacteria bacterium]
MESKLQEFLGRIAGQYCAMGQAGVVPRKIGLPYTPKNFPVATAD